MRADCHVHSEASDGWGTCEQLAARAKEVGLDCIALTDHDTIEAHEEMARACHKHKLGFIPGIEVSSRQGHILGFWVQEKIPSGLSALATIDAIHKAGGLAAASHPYSFMPKGVARLSGSRLVGFDAVEVVNASPSMLLANARALRRFVADPSAYAVLGNSDAHAVASVGSVVTTYPSSTNLRSAILSHSTGVQVFPRPWYH